ncbi:MAG: hypothetical protein EBS79_08105 [Gammaproteobacteria bacterium]|nr:hypothetical protein [Gammaproteobacteria bacterium]
MRLVEFASAEEQMALWKLISDKVWTSIAIQAKQQAKAAKQRKAKTKRATRQSTVPVQPVPMPKPNSVTPVQQPQPQQNQPVQPKPISGFGSGDVQISQKVATQNSQALR